MTRQDLAGLRQVQFEQKQELKLTAESVYQQVRASEKDTLLAWDTVAKRQAQEKATLQDFIHELEVKLATEKELRQGQISDLDRTITVERQAWAGERQKLELHIEDLVRQTHATDDLLETANREKVRLESQLVAAETDLKAKEQQIIELKRQVRESDDALGCAVRGNEHLREQIEEQMQRYQEMNAKDLAAANAQFEERLKSAKAKADGEMQQLTRHLRQVEEQHSNKAAELEKVKQQADATEMERASTARDMSMWKNQYTTATEMRQELERELAETRQEWSKEKLRLQEALDDHGQARQLLEADLKVTTEQFHEYKRQAQQRETDYSTRVHAFEETLRQREGQLSEYMNSLVDQQEMSQRVKQELTAEQTRSAEVKSRLEAELEQRTAEKNDIARRLEHTIVTERRELGEAKEQYDRWREAHVYSLKQVQDEAAVKVSALEKEKSMIEDRLRTELLEEKQKVETTKRKMEALETDLTASHKQLHATQQESATSRSQAEKLDRELHAVREKAAAEAKSLTHALSDARLVEKRLASELKEELQAREREENRHKKDLDELKSASASQVMDIDQKFRGMKAEYESTLMLTESRYREAVTREKSKLDTISGENDQLRKIISSGEYRAPAIGTLTSTLEGHLSRFSSKVDDVRAELGASRPLDRTTPSVRSASPGAGLLTSPSRELGASRSALGLSGPSPLPYTPNKSSTGAAMRYGSLDRR